jgi:sulfur-carrier protein
MKVRIRFFARFRELLGTDIIAEPAEGTPLIQIVRDVAGKNKEGFDAIFDGNGDFRSHVILMKNGRRIETAAAAETLVGDGDDIAVFPPVAGG